MGSLRGWVALAVLSLGVSVGVSSCCDQPEFSMGDMGLRAKFSVSVAIDIEFSFDLEIDFDGDLSAWADLGAATWASFDYDFSGKVAYAQELEVDIDDDGVSEHVKFLVFSDGDPNDYDRGFATWRGDRYSFDKGYCYVLSWQGDDALLMSAPCGSQEPALACPVQAGEADASECQVCDEGGNCASCSSDKVAECIEQGSAKLEPDVDAMSTGGAAGAAGAPGTTGGGTVSVDFDSCVEEVDQLAGAGKLCGVDVTGLDNAALCEDTLSEVNLCFVAVVGSGLFGANCDVVNSDVCDAVYR